MTRPPGSGTAYRPTRSPSQGALPAVAIPDVKSRLLPADIAAHNLSQLDVADDQ